MIDVMHSWRRSFWTVAILIFAGLIIALVPLMKTAKQDLKIARSLPILEIGTTGAGPKSSILLPPTHGIGDTTLPSIKTHNMPFSMEFSCLGSGTFAISNVIETSDCQGHAQTYVGNRQGIVKLEVIADPTIHWEIGISLGY